MKILMRFITRLLKNKAALLLLVAVVAVAFMPELTHAAETSAALTSEKVAQSIASLLSIAMQFLNALLWPILIIIGDLMSTDLILSPAMEGTLKAIWVPVRDLVNIGFVLVLLVVAFYNVLGIGGGEGDLALKTALPKIVLGLVIVNFTFVAGKVVIDLTNVATTAVFALPEMAAGDDTPYDFSAVTTKFKINVCYKKYYEDTGLHDSWDADLTAEKDIPIYTKLFCTKSTTDGTYDELNGVLAARYFSDLNANNIGLVMAVNMGGLSNLSILKDEGINDFTDLTVSFVFAVVMYLVFATSYIVLALVLITRLVVLWIALALSPLAVLTYVVPQIKEWTGGGGDFAQKIIKHLVAPIIIGATMSLGYLLIAAWDGMAGNSSLANGGFEVDQVISTEFLINGVKDLPHFIIAIASIVIVWTGVFAAADGTYAQMATDGIKGFGTSIRDFALKLPMSIPTVPLGVDAEGKESKISLGALKMWGDTAMQGVTNGSWNHQQLTDLSGKGVSFFGIPLSAGENTNPQAAASNLLRESRNPDIDYTRAATMLKDLMYTINGSSSLKGSQKVALYQKAQAAQERFAKGDSTVKLDDLTKILNDHSAEELGLDAGELTTVKGNLHGKTLNRTNAPNPPGGTGGSSGGGGSGGGSSSPVDPVINLVSSSTFNTNLSNVTGATLPAGTPTTTAPLVTTFNDSVRDARAALTAFKGDTTSGKKTAAQGAITAALTAATALETDTGSAPLRADLALVVAELTKAQSALTPIPVTP